MKPIKILICLLLGIVSCNAQSIEFIPKGETFTAPRDIIVMDKYTFGKYHYTCAQYDTLKKEFYELESLLKEKDSVSVKVISSYESLLHSRTKEVNTYKSGYEETKGLLLSSIDKNTQLQISYQKLQEKNQRTKKWRNIFLGASVFSTSLLVFVLVH